MKRRQVWRIGATVLVGVAAISLGVAGALGAWRDKTDETWERVRREGVLRVGLDASYPPFESVDPGSSGIIGLDADLAQAIAERLGIARVQLVNTGYDGLYDALSSGRFDLILSALPYDPWLVKDYSFSHSYFDAGSRVLVGQGSCVVSLDQLPGERVALVQGSEADAEIRGSKKHGDWQVLPRDEPAQVLDALLSGEASAAVVDGVIAVQFLAQHEGYRMLSAQVTEEPFVGAVRIDCPLLLDAVNGAIDHLRESGWIDETVSKWLR